MSVSSSPAPTLPGAASASTSSSAPAPAQLAKGALRRMAQERLEPTPENYQKAYQAEAAALGHPVAGSAAAAGDAMGGTASGAGSAVNAAQAAQTAQGSQGAQPADDGPAWAELIGRISRGLERSHREWTAARKKDSLQRVLSGSRQSGTRLLARLQQLVQAWDSGQPDGRAGEDAPSPPAEADAPSGGPAAAGGQDAAAPLAGGAPLPDSGAATSVALGTASPAVPQAEAVGDGGASSSATLGAPGGAAATHDTQSRAGDAHGAVDEVSASAASRAEAPTWAARQLQATLAAALPAQEATSIDAQAAVESALDRVLAEQAHPLPEAVSAQLTDALAQVRRVADHRHHLVDQLVELCRTLTDSLIDVAEDDSWVQGQCQAMRAELDDGLSHRGTRRVQQLLEDTRQRQHDLRRERDAARQALKHLIHQMLAELAELGSATGRFEGKLAGYAETIGQADTLESLTGVVREMVEESRAVHAVVSQTRERIHTEHARATELTERVQRLEAEIRKLSDEVSTDPLTQIANRRGLMNAFEAERSRVERQGEPLSIGLLDVDNFKKLNDTLGHHTGDEALKFLSRRVGESLRPSDALARYGGEEFVVLMPGTGVDEGQQVLTRLQRQLSAEFFTQDENKVFITFSAGVTEYRLGETIEVALDRADVALYEAKRTGKNKTCIG